MAVESLAAPPATGGLLLRAALGVLPFGGRRGGDTLPDLTLELPSATVDPAHLAAYARVCGFGLRDELPLTYPHVLAFPLALRLLTDRAFPFPMVGLVHVRNVVTRRHPLLLGTPFGLRVRCADLRPHDRGRQFDVVHEAIVDGEPVWSSVRTNLRRVSAPGGSPAERGGTGRPAGEPGELPPPTALWRVPADAGRRYAAVSGDRNPIHLHALAARAFGFRRAIAHGMWTKARCLAALEGRLPVACVADVTFARPVFLPSTVAFRTGHAGADWTFDLRDARSGRPHLLGTVTPASQEAPSELG
ncbi:MAG TPA: MaoC/PaaZ C-terminal domain-containing protein [Pseudonocardiaceae bacterium]